MCPTSQTGCAVEDHCPQHNDWHNMEMLSGMTWITLTPLATSDYAAFQAITLPWLTCDMKISVVQWEILYHPEVGGVVILVWCTWCPGVVIRKFCLEHLVWWSWCAGIGIITPWHMAEVGGVVILVWCTWCGDLVLRIITPFDKKSFPYLLMAMTLKWLSRT